MTPDEVTAAIDRELARVRDAILAKAARQDAFAGPEYHHLTEADRRLYRHAANVLRDAAQLARRAG